MIPTMMQADMARINLLRDLPRPRKAPFPEPPVTHAPRIPDVYLVTDSGGRAIWEAEGQTHAKLLQSFEASAEAGITDVMSRWQVERANGMLGWQACVFADSRQQ